MDVIQNRKYKEKFIPIPNRVRCHIRRKELGIFILDFELVIVFGSRKLHL